MLNDPQALRLLQVALDYLPYILLCGAILSLVFGIFKKVIKLLVAGVAFYVLMQLLLYVVGTYYPV